jgi:hypothetical protein
MIHEQKGNREARHRARLRSTLASGHDGERAQAEIGSDPAASGAGSDEGAQETGLPAVGLQFDIKSQRNRVSFCLFIDLSSLDALALTVPCYPMYPVISIITSMSVMWQVYNRVVLFCDLRVAVGAQQH